MKLSRQLCKNINFLPNSERTSTKDFVNWNVNGLLSSKDVWIWSDMTMTSYHHLLLFNCNWNKEDDRFTYFLHWREKETTQSLFFLKQNLQLFGIQTYLHIFPCAAAFLNHSHSSLRWIMFCWSCLISKYCWSNLVMILMCSAGFL